MLVTNHKVMNVYLWVNIPYTDEATFNKKKFLYPPVAFSDTQPFLLPQSCGIDLGSKCQHFRERRFWEPWNLKLAWSGRGQLNLVLAKVLRDPRLNLIWRIAKFWNISKLLQTEQLARFRDLLIFPLQVPLVLDERQVLLDRLLSDA